MKKSVMQKWVKALRSGRYKQGRGSLKTAKGSYCCLGVLCDISKLSKWKKLKTSGDIEYISHSTTLPTAVQKWAGMSSCNGSLDEKYTFHLAVLNDDEKLSFKELADLIEKDYKSL